MASDRLKENHMRKFLALILAAGLMACATSVDTPISGPAAPGKTAAGRDKDLPPPPPITDPAQPPQGVGKSGLNFGSWKSGNPDELSAAFGAEAAKRFPAGRDLLGARAALELDGFQCRDANRPDGRPVPQLECRLGVMERQCGMDWTVEIWSASEAAKGRFDVMCLGAMPSRR
jgi:hypothetical protein